MPPSKLATQFGLRVRELRTARGLSQAALAGAANLHRTHVSLIERAGRVVRLETVERLAAALGVEPADLLRPPTGDHRG